MKVMFLTLPQNATLLTKVEHGMHMKKIRSVRRENAKVFLKENPKTNICCSTESRDTSFNMSQIQKSNQLVKKVKQKK